jgi:hypothetical protein
MGRHSIETDRKNQRNILVRPPNGKQTQNLDFASGEVVGKSDATVPGVHQGIDIGDQARHPKTTRELFCFAQQLEAEPSIRTNRLS